MSRYIDADALIADLDKGLWGKDYDKALAEAIIQDAPSIEITFCKECKWYKQSETFCENGNGLWQAGDDCFCNYGEREGE